MTPDILVGTFGKSFGSQGAFVAGSLVLRDWLWNRARSFVFSTGLSPMAADAARLGLEEATATPLLRERVRALALRLREGLAALDLHPLGFGHIVPVVLGSNERAIAVAAELAKHGLVVPPIRPPTVPEGTARLRFTVTAAHEEQHIDTALAAVRGALEALR